MKKLLIIVLATTMLALGAYVAGSWYLGIEVEAALARPLQQLASVPYLKVLKREYRRGVFGSEETISLELFGDMARLAQPGNQGAASVPEGSAAPFEALRFSVRSHIRHGPLVDGRTLAAAIVDSTLDVDPKRLPALAGALAGRPLLSARTVYRFGGDGESVCVSAPLSFSVPQAPARISWQGSRMTLRFSGDWSHYTIEGDAPGLDIAGDAMHVALAGMRVHSEAGRVFADEPLFYAGRQRLALDQAGLDGRAMGDNAVVLKRIAYEVDVPLNGAFLDVLARIGVQDVLVGTRNFGPAHYDLSLKHLHARTLAQLQRAWLNLQAQLTQTAQSGNSAEVFAPLAAPALKLLEYDPEISLDRLSFQGGDAEVRITARAKLTGASADDLKQPAQMLAKLDASADIALPENLLMTPWGVRADTPELAQAHMRMREQQLAVLAAQGYIEREDGRIRSTLGFERGAFTVNGRTFDPRALQAPPPAAAPALREQPARARRSR